jgi:hypothetical protein
MGEMDWRSWDDISEELRSADKWTWMMRYCKRHELPPAQEWAWSKAEKAYKMFTEEK